ncbi:MAG: hypothetical protein PCFJNLEI_03458 [Verrucomicrobiae bacterium]|nr:hypothetical protein [Verrucomicrobiae bacterium]
MTLPERQRLLLTLLAAIDEPVGNTDFQKLLFLYTQTQETTPSYEFVPYKFGGFSFTSYADKRRLAEAGLLTQDDQHWELTPQGRETARKQALLPLVVGKFCREHSKLRGNSLIAEQYRRFPYYATRSEIVEKVLPDADSRKAVAKARPPKAQPGLLTVGYEGRTLEAYLNVLLRNSVTLLCDVRRNPISRKYGFSKKTLSHACENVGIRYEHLPELGIDSEERRDLNTQADYDALFAEYERKSLPKQKAALAKIVAWVKDGERVALTCFERLPEQCHRHCVAEALENYGGKASKVVHL